MTADEFCRAKVVECDVLVGIVGHFHGSAPEHSEQSYTEREYEAAVGGEKPRLMFISPADFPLAADLVEPDEKREKQRAFRERIGQERVRAPFTSPDDLARGVTQAIFNWEQEQATAPRGREPPISQAALPLPPQPYFAHPYPLQRHFTGRVRERRMLTEWLSDGQQPVLALTAIGGMGKSALTWAWLLRDVLGETLPGADPELLDVAETCRLPEGARPTGVLWWSFYEREARFAVFLDRALTYASGGIIDPAAVPSSHDKVQALVDLLQQRRILLVLDGFERELRAYASLSAAYQGETIAEDERGDFRSCTDPHAADFLRRVASLPLQGRILLTSRLAPRELDGLGGARGEALTAMDPEDAVAFFRAQRVKGTRAEVQAACEPYGYHPLAVRLLAGLVVRDKRQPGDIRVAARYPVLPELVGKERHHILQVAYDSLEPRNRELLSRISAFRSPMDYDALSILNPYKSDRRFDAALDELIDRGLLLLDTERGLYDLHPVVRQYAYDRLSSKDGLHAQLRDYFAAVPAPDRDEVQGMEDLAPVIELYHHTVGAGGYDEALKLFHDRFGGTLYYRLSAYQTCIELLRALFPNGEDQSPKLKTENDQAWTLNELAISYSRSGEPSRAVPLKPESTEGGRRVSVLRRQEGAPVLLG